MNGTTKVALRDYEGEHVATVAELQQEVAFLKSVEDATRVRRQSLMQRIANVVVAGNRVRDESSWGRQFMGGGR